MIRPVCFWPGLGLSGPCYSTPIPIPTPTPIHTLTYSHMRIPVGLRHDLRRGGDAIALPARCASTPNTPTHSLRFPALWPQATEKRQSGRREASGRAASPLKRKAEKLKTERRCAQGLRKSAERVGRRRPRRAEGERGMPKEKRESGRRRLAAPHANGSVCVGPAFASCQ
jgi:hypothetical protein